jgi:hypothetical protein
MKKTLLFGALIVFVIGSITAQQQIPNGGFETWNAPIPQFEDPDDWATLNEYGIAFSGYTTFKSDDAAMGSFSAKLESIAFGVFVLPGAITLGYYDVNMSAATATIEGGIAFTDRPIAIQGSYKNYPVAGDFSMVGVLLTRYNASKGERDTIGIVMEAFPQTVDTWTTFNLPINYTSEDAPDSLNVFVVSSNMLNLQAGSIMYVDNLSFEYVAGIGDLEHSVQTSIFPNPASNMVSFSFGEELSGSLNIYSNDGQLVYSQTVKGKEHSVDVSTYAAGTYYFSVLEGNKKVSSGQLVISR